MIKADISHVYITLVYYDDVKELKLKSKAIL